MRGWEEESVRRKVKMMNEGGEEWRKEAPTRLIFGHKVTRHHYWRYHPTSPLIDELTYTR